jgi:hypothetical protein
MGSVSEWIVGATAIGTVIAAAAAFLSARAAAKANKLLKEERRAADARSARSYTLPLLSEVFTEFRTKEFRDGVSYLVNATPKPAPDDGFRGAPGKWQDHAYRVCYFFDYVGILGRLDIVQDEVAISLLGSPAIQVWDAVEEIVHKERVYRKENFLGGSWHGFLRYYEDLVRRILDHYAKEPLELCCLAPDWRKEAQDLAGPIPLLTVSRVP